MRRRARGTTARPDGCHRATEQGGDRSDRTFCPRLGGGSTYACQMSANLSGSEERREPGSDTTSPLAIRVVEGSNLGCHAQLRGHDGH
eukprot:3079078-Pyramimonas_sp.AAC.1